MLASRAHICIHMHLYIRIYLIVHVMYAYVYISIYICVPPMYLYVHIYMFIHHVHLPIYPHVISHMSQKICMIISSYASVYVLCNIYYIYDCNSLKWLNNYLFSYVSHSLSLSHTHTHTHTYTYTRTQSFF